MEVSLSPRLWADAGAPQNGRTKAGDEAWSQGPTWDEAQVSLRKLHCASVPRAAAAGQTAGPSVCCLSSIAGSEAKAGAMSEQAGPSGKGQLKNRQPSRMASSPGRNPGSLGGNGWAQALEWRWSQTKSQPGQKGAGMTRRCRPPVERSDPPRTKSRQRQGRTQQIK